MTQPSSSRWTFYGTEVTDANGRATHHISDDKKLPQGMYPVKMIVRYEVICSCLVHTIESFLLSRITCPQSSSLKIEQTTMNASSEEASLLGSVHDLTSYQFTMSSHGPVHELAWTSLKSS